MEYKIGQRVRVSEPIEFRPDMRGKDAKTHYGRIEDIVADMYGGSDLYLVNVLGEIKTYKKESLISLKKDKNTSRNE